MKPEELHPQLLDFYIILYCVILCYIMLYDIIEYNIILYDIILYWVSTDVRPRPRTSGLSVLARPALVPRPGVGLISFSGLQGSFTIVVPPRHLKRAEGFLGRGTFEFANVRAADAVPFALANWVVVVALARPLSHPIEICQRRVCKRRSVAQASNQKSVCVCDRR